MFSILGRGVRLCDGISRREALRVGGLGALGLGLPEFLGAKPRDDARPGVEWYETYQSQGEITGLANYKARVRIAVQKKISEANLTLIARTKEDHD